MLIFAGFATSSQIGGRILDKRGARPSVVVGCAVAAIGFALWARQLPDLDLGSQWPWIVLAGAGAGLVLGPANTDAINRAPRTSYGEATGITQTVRNFGSSLGLAVMGSVLILENKANLEDSFVRLNIPRGRPTRSPTRSPGEARGRAGSPRASVGRPTPPSARFRTTSRSRRGRSSTSWPG
jgi:Major Facilitator Superfamily